jgi:hypothetical protein
VIVDDKCTDLGFGDASKLARRAKRR